MAAIGISREIRVVFEQMNRPANSFLMQTLLCLDHQFLEDALSSLILGNEIGDSVALSCCVLRMTADVQIETCSIFQEDIRRSPPRDDSPEEVSGHFIGAQPALATQGTRDTIFGFEPEYPSLHVNEGIW